MCSGRIAAKGGRPKGVVQAAAKGLPGGRLEAASVIRELSSLKDGVQERLHEGEYVADNLAHVGAQGNSHGGRLTMLP